MPEEKPEHRPETEPITKELRRFLGMPRSVRGRRAQEREALKKQAAALTEKQESEQRRADIESEKAPPSETKGKSGTESSQSPTKRTPRIGIKSDRTDLPRAEQKVMRPPTALALDEKSARASEMRHVVLIIGAILLVFFGFYAGRKIDYWKYLYATRITPKLSKKTTDKFPGVAADELVNRALIAERNGKLKEAAELLVAAKHKNLALPGALLRVAKLVYEQGDLVTADKIFDRAIAFRENIDVANYFRGMIAARRRDFTAAERFFEAATKAEPFISEYYYYWAEALRLDFHPKEAIPHYAEAALRARAGQDVSVCYFKIRMAQIEAADATSVRTELEKQKKAGALAVDWLMTESALHIFEGRIDPAVRLVNTAWDAYQPGLFSSCSHDALFISACKKYPELAKACHLDLSPKAAFP